MSSYRRPSLRKRIGRSLLEWYVWLSTPPQSWILWLLMLIAIVIFVAVIGQDCIHRGVATYECGGG